MTVVKLGKMLCNYLIHWKIYCLGLIVNFLLDHLPHINNAVVSEAHKLNRIKTRPMTILIKRCLQ